MTRTHHFASFCALLALSMAFLIPTLSFAGTISSSVPMIILSGSGNSQVNFPVGVITTNANNDNDSGANSSNNLSVSTQVLVNDSIIDLVFNVEPSSGTTEYTFKFFIDNNTNVDWSEFTFELGFGTGASFQRLSSLSNISTTLDFDTPNRDPGVTSTIFSNVTHDSDRILFSNGTHSSGAVNYEIHLDIPDLPNGQTDFTLRQFATEIPEPSSLTLFGLALFALIPVRAVTRK